jgi:PadR family transcriptional regulator PadR
MMAPDPAPFKRDLFLGSLDVLVLAILADGRQYGYAILKELEQASGQSVRPGSLYPILHRMEEAGWITATWDESAPRRRKWYTLTPTGKAALRKQAATWQAYLARLQGTVLPAVRRVAGSQRPG